MIQQLKDSIYDEETDVVFNDMGISRRS